LKTIPEQSALSYNTVVGSINPPAGYAIKIYSPHNPTLQVQDATVIYNDNPETGALFLPSYGSFHPLSCQVKNWGNVTLAPFNVNGFVKDPNGNQVVTDDVTTDSLSISETQNITFTLPFSPVMLEHISTSRKQNRAATMWG
jgi:hypothetical protein